MHGTDWSDQIQPKAYLHMLEEAEKRDHRRIGRELNLFHLQEEAAGAVFWHPNGWTLYRTVQSYMRTRLEGAVYVEVNTLQLVVRTRWGDAVVWGNFRQSIFVTEDEEKVLAIKPMNCACHVQIFSQGIKSYRDLPYRMAEFGSCHRNEPSGALHGLMRVRAFTQDDAHIFCTNDQITSETKIFCDLLMSIYKDFGFEDVIIKYSDRPQVRAGGDEVWERAECALKEAVKAADYDYVLNPGEGAFYGPKLEFVLRDAIGRDWQCGTLQVDFVLPERLDASYIGMNGEKHRPVMLHRAILGSFERFIGILIENFSGRFPLWLAPLQIVVASITDEAASYAEDVVVACRAVSLKAETDVRNEKINFKVREHSVAKVPVIFVVGAREATNRTVSIRRLGGKEQEIVALAQAVDTLAMEAAMPSLLSD